MKTLKSFHLKPIAMAVSVLLLVACGRLEPGDYNPLNRKQTSDNDSLSGHKIQDPVFFQGKKDVPVEEPELPPEIAAQREKVPFTIKSPNLKIDLDTKQMTFTAKIESEKSTEEVALQGSFNPKSRQWLAELYAIDKTLLEQRRVQAVAMCLEAYICDRVAVDVYYKYEGKVYRKQYLSRVAKVASPRPMSPSINMGGTASQVVSSPNGSTPVLDFLEEQEENNSQTVSPVTKPSEKPEDKKPDAGDVNKKQETTGDEKKSSATTEAKPEQTSTIEATNDKAQGLQLLRQDEQQARLQFISDRSDWEDEVILPSPSKNPFNIDDLKVVEMSQEYKAQAIGSHVRGYLQNAVFMPNEGLGFFRPIAAQNPESQAGWGTKLLLDLISKSAEELERVVPNRPPLVIGSLSKKRGGKLGRHFSHQTGLDADIGFLTKTVRKQGFWDPRRKGKLDDEFDFERNWNFVKLLNNTVEDHIIVIFVDPSIKKHLCLYVKSQNEYSKDPKSLAFKALQSLDTREAGHHNHYHLRLLCPRTAGCQNAMVTLGNQTGCEAYIKN